MAVTETSKAFLSITFWTANGGENFPHYKDGTLDPIAQLYRIRANTFGVTDLGRTDTYINEP